MKKGILIMVTLLFIAALQAESPKEKCKFQSWTKYRKSHQQVAESIKSIHAQYLVEKKEFIIKCKQKSK